MSKRELVRQMAEKMEEIDSLRSELDALEQAFVMEVQGNRGLRALRRARAPRDGEAPTPKRGSVAAKVLRRIAKRQMRVSEVAEAFEVGASYASQVLKKLAEDGHITKVGRGVYAGLEAEAE